MYVSVSLPGAVSPMPERFISLIGHPARDTKRFPDGHAEQSLGGVSFSASAMAALTRETGLSTTPVTTLGTDIAAEGQDLLARAGCRLDAVRVSNRATQHSEITFTSENDRFEHVSGILPPIDFEHVAPWLTGRAVAVNFISGTEMSLPTLRRVRGAASGPIVMDYHTLALSTQDDGRRVYHLRRDWAEWISHADVVQMNENEASTLAGRPLADPNQHASFARELLNTGPRAVVITLADAGAVGAERTNSGFRTHRVEAGGPARVVDTVGCGDVFHAALTVGWVEFGRLGPALRLANDAAGRHAGYSGIEGIARLGESWSAAN